MNSDAQTASLEMLDMKTKLSTLWVFMLLNVIFADIHGFFKPGFLAEVLTGSVDGVEMTEGLFLVSAIALEISIVMVILSRVLKYRVNRWANIIAALITIASVIGLSPVAPDRIFFGSIEIVSMIAVIWLAWKWTTPEEQS